MKKVTLDKHNIVAGLYWASLAGEKPSAELSVLAREVVRPFGFSRKVTKEDGSASYQAALTEDKSVLGSVSGAAVIAETFRDIIYVEKLSAQEVWICAVADSEVMVGGDVVISPGKLVSEFQRISENYKEAPVFVFGENLSDVVELKELPESDETLSFGKLLEKAEVFKIGKEFNSFKVSTLESKSKPVLMGVVSLAILSAVGYTQFGSDFFGSTKDMTSHVDLSSIITKSTKTNEDILEEARNEEIDELREELNSSDPIALIKRVLAFDIIQSKFVNGWKAASIEYNDKQPYDILLHWTRTEIGTPLSLRMGIGEDIKTIADLDGNTATSTFQVIDKVNNHFNKDFDVIDMIENNGYMHENMMHDLISMDYQWSMKNLNLGDRETKIKGLDRKAKKDENVRQLKLKTTTVNIKGTNRDQLSALIKIFESAKTFKINKIKATLNEESFRWEVIGVLYES